MTPSSDQTNQLFHQSLSVVNVGLPAFAESLRLQNVPVVEVDWRPPPAGVPRLTHTQSGVSIDEANAEAVRRIMAGRPEIVGLGRARDVIPGLADNMILHAGPPITWERMCGPTDLRVQKHCQNRPGTVYDADWHPGQACDVDAVAVIRRTGTNPFEKHYFVVFFEHLEGEIDFCLMFDRGEFVKVGREQSLHSRFEEMFGDCPRNR